MTKSAVIKEQIKLFGDQATSLTDHKNKTVKKFTCNRLNITSMKKMYEEIGEFVKDKKVLSFDTTVKFMNISVIIIAEVIKPDIKGITITLEPTSVVGNKMTSKYRGVFWDKVRGKWKVEMKNAGARYYLGRFDNEKEAAYAYDKKAREVLGSAAIVNFKECF